MILFNLYAALSLISAVVSGGLVWNAWRLRQTRGARTLSFLCLGLTVWAFAYMFEVSAVVMTTQIFWAKMQYLGITTIPPLFFIFAIVYTGRDAWLDRRLALLLIEPLLMLAVVWTNEYHYLVWDDIYQQIVQIPLLGPNTAAAAAQTGGFPLLRYTYQIAFWLNAAYLYVLLLSGTWLIFRFRRQASGIYRQQSNLLLIGAFAPWLANFVYLFGWNPFLGLDLTPFAFTITSLLASWGLFRYRLLDIVPVARDRVMESMQEAVVVLDEQNRIIDLNPSARQNIGPQAELVLGKPVEDAFSQWTDTLGQFGDVTEAHEVVTLETHQGTRHFDLRISSILDANGKRQARVVVADDITDHIQVEQSLRQTQQRLEFLVANSPAVMYAAQVRDALRLTFISPNVSELLGYGAQDFLNNPYFWSEHLHPDDRERVLKALKDLASVHSDLASRQENLAPPHTVQEYRFMHQDGSYRWLRDEVRLAENAGGIRSEWIGSWIDITGRMAAEQEMQQARQMAEAASIAKSTFLANMSHELRTPLAVMIGYSEMLLQKALEKQDATAARRLERITAAGDQLVDMITNVLEYAQLERGTIELHYQAIELYELVNAALEEIRSLAEKNRNRLELQIEDGISMQADPLRLRQVLLSLLDNAAKFTQDGAVTLKIKSHLEQGQVWVDFVVRDTGIGISPEQQIEIFTPFTQADASPTRIYGGIGLSLALSRRLCQIMGGEMSMESTQAGGSTFTVRLPAEPPPPSADKPLPSFVD